LKIAKAITEIYAEIEKCQLDINSYNTSKIDKLGWLRKKQGLELALEIIKENMKSERR
jgi:hypothetical protein